MIDTLIADMCFIIFTITHSLYYVYHVNFFKSLLKSIPEQKKFVIIMFLFKNDVDMLYQKDLSKNDTNHLCLEF